jgi:hypothetical protein
VRWDDSGAGNGSGSLVGLAVNGTPASTSDIVETDVPSWQMLVRLKALAQDMMLKPVRGTSLGTELFHVFMHPNALAELKLDDKFMAAMKDAMPRTPNHPLFKSFDTIYVDGLAISSHRHSFHPSNWGAGGNVRGNRILLCGAQALGYAEIGRPYWEEDYKDYRNRPAISVGQMNGFLKPQFENDRTGTVEDFSILACDVGLPTT